MPNEARDSTGDRRNPIPAPLALLAPHHPMEVYSIQQPLHIAIDPGLKLITWQGDRINLAEDCTHWGFVYQGKAELYRQQEAQTFLLYPGMYFCLPGGGSIGHTDSCGVVISCLQTQGMFSLGGPVEPKGRFAYIDGGMNSLLIPPVYAGDPCLNALYFPPHCNQTMHTHPSCRIGVVLGGGGEVITPDRSIPLQPGTLFYIQPHSLHKFRTGKSGIFFVVFHPDSDIGFSHQNNPMLNRTIVTGVSAANIPEIQTPLEAMSQTISKNE